MAESFRYRQSELLFEWDPEKARINEEKHRVTFPDAASCWYDPYKIMREDEPHSWDETRIQLVDSAEGPNSCSCATRTERKAGD